MPGFAVHQIFGEESLKGYEDSYVKECIEEHSELYNMGLQGPDFFFYFVLSPLLYKKNPGSVMHTKNIGLFKQNFIRSIQFLKNEEEKKIATAYFAGFLGHCTLDKICHPYVYAVTDYAHKGKNYFSSHVELETEIDNRYVRKYKKMDLYYFRTKEMMAINRTEIEVLVNVFAKAFKRTYPNIKLSKKRLKFIIQLFKESSHIFHDKYGMKKKISGMVEELVFRRKIISPMFITERHKKSNEDVLNMARRRWYHPWDEKSIHNESFPELFEMAIEEYRIALRELDSYFKEGKEELLNYCIENISLHSGLDCRIPS